MKNYEVAALLDIYQGVLTEKQRDLIDLYYNEDLSLGEIAENRGITRQGVRDAVKRSEFVLFDLEENLGVARRRDQLAVRIKEAQALIEKINTENENACHSGPIRELTDQLLKLLEATQEEF